MLHGALLENHWNRQFSKSFPGPQQCYDHMSSCNTNLSVRLIFMEASFPFAFFWLLKLFCLKVISSLKFSRQKNFQVSCCHPSKRVWSSTSRVRVRCLFSTRTFHVFETIDPWTALLGKIALRGYGSKVNKRCWNVETQQVGGFPPELRARSTKKGASGHLRL